VGKRKTDMTGWAEEAISAEELVREAVKKLLALDPNHELLRYWILREGEETSDEIEAQIKTEMKNRFWDRSTPWEKEAGVIVITIVLTNYFVALRNAIEEITCVVKTPAPTEEEAPATVGGEEEVDIPF
jgi:hypothetical protein